MSKLYPNLFQLLWYSSLPCYHLPGLSDEFMVKKCQVAGRKIECSRIFRQVPTDIGMCCALNAQSVIKESEYSDLISKMQESSEFLDKQSLGSTEKVSVAVGLGNGLKLTLDLHSNFQSFGTVVNDFDAFRLFIGQSTEFPAMTEKSLVIQPGHEHFLDLSSHSLSTSGIEMIRPEDRNCYFQYEGDLEFYAKYTFINCRFECGLRHTKQAQNCTPWYFPQDQAYPVCDPWRERLFSEELTNVHEDESKCLHCLPDCEIRDISVTASMAKFR